MKHGSLFSGIGGFDLAAQWMEWENIFHCEIDPFCQTLLKHYWPHAKSYSDITSTDFTIHRGAIDVLTGGFPCQPFSLAGSRGGTADSRYLWPEMFGSIRQIRPRWIIAENVQGVLTWKGGMVIKQMQTDLESEGYEVFTPYILPACGINAPHRRNRVWIIAHRENDGLESGRQPCVHGKTAYPGPEGNGKTQFAANGTNPGIESLRQQENPIDRSEIIADPGRSRQPGQGGTERPGHPKTFGNGEASWFNNAGRWPVESPVCAGNDGFPGKLDSITVSKWRKESIKGAGNAIVPQLALQIFRAIQHCEQQQ